MSYNNVRKTKWKYRTAQPAKPALLYMTAFLNFSQFPLFSRFYQPLPRRWGKTKNLSWFEPRWHAVYRCDMRYIEVNISEWLLIRQCMCFVFSYSSQRARKLETGKAFRTCSGTVACVGKLSGNIHLSFLWIDGVYVFVCTRVQKASLWFLNVATSGEEWRKNIVSLFFRLLSFKNLDFAVSSVLIASY